MTRRATRQGARPGQSISGVETLAHVALMPATFGGFAGRQRSPSPVFAIDDGVDVVAFCRLTPVSAEAAVAVLGCFRPGRIPRRLTAADRTARRRLAANQAVAA